MMTKSNIRIFIIALLMVCQGGVVCADEMIRLPLRVHIVTGVDMIREPDKTVMNMPVTVADAETIMRQVNEIWAPASIWWETDVKNGGGGVIEEVAGGGKLGDARLKELARLIAPLGA